MKGLAKRLTLILLCVLLSTQSSRALGWDSPKREVRAVWLTTIGGLDWPRQKAHSASSIEAQKHELCQILDQLKAANFNTVLLQTRIRSSVIYPSAIEPWDDCLTGHADRNPGYDPLAFAVEECHKRGIEIHAWIVAFPGNSFKSATALGRKAIQRRVPRLCLKTNEFWMLNPGEPETADYLADICSEIARNYDVDGINLDYIRYPESTIRFNDATTYRKYGGGMDKADWRRQNVTHCVETIYKAVKSVRPWIRVSCSPVGKSQDLTGYSSHGWNSFHTVYQDAQGWLKKGIMDMVVPMMYFRNGNNFYPFMLDWEEEACGHIFCGGLGAYKLLESEENWSLGELINQLNTLRQSGAKGQAFFRTQQIIQDTKGLYQFLKNDFYRLPALTPSLCRQDSCTPATPISPQIVEMPEGFTLQWAHNDKQGITYNIYRSENFPVNIEKAENLCSIRQKETAFTISLRLPSVFLPYYAVTAVDLFGNESPPIAFNRPLSGVQSFCTGLLTSSDDFKHIFLPQNTAKYVMVTDAVEQIVRTEAYTRILDISDLANGLYSIRTLEEKGRSSCLGKLFIKH